LCSLGDTVFLLHYARCVDEGGTKTHKREKFGGSEIGYAVHWNVVLLTWRGRTEERMREKATKS